MINCPDCEADQLFVIDTRVPVNGKYTRRRLECRNCQGRFTSHEIREMDLADNSLTHFSQILNKIRVHGRIPKPFRGILKPKPQKVLVAGSWFQRYLVRSQCCSIIKERLVNR